MAAMSVLRAQRTPGDYPRLSRAQPELVCPGRLESEFSPDIEHVRAVGIQRRLRGCIRQPYQRVAQSSGHSACAANRAAIVRAWNGRLCGTEQFHIALPGATSGRDHVGYPISEQKWRAQEQLWSAHRLRLATRD